MLLHGVHNIWIEVLKTSLKYIVFLVNLELFYWVCESESRLKRANIHKFDHVVQWTLCTMTSLSGEALPAQCIVHFVLVKSLLCRHYPMLKGLCFSGVSQDLAVSQTGYLTRKCSEKDFTAYNQSV